MHLLCPGGKKQTNKSWTMRSRQLRGNELLHSRKSRKEEIYTQSTRYRVNFKIRLSALRRLHVPNRHKRKKGGNSRANTKNFVKIEGIHTATAACWCRWITHLISLRAPWIAEWSTKPALFTPKHVLPPSTMLPSLSTFTKLEAVTSLYIRPKGLIR